MPVIEVSHLTKEYRLGALQGLKQTLLNTGARLIGKPVQEPPLFKALDDVSFSIEQGEVVGIIGHNGAGKSTLLKMLARITTPSSGSVKVNGRIAPLIEVGAGFVPDFTGRENVYLNGAILGMSKKEIDQKFDEIVDFAEMAEFVDTPVKRYSSGMQVKLAFAVATSIEAEILIVDEVLAVGDLAFQRKCFDRMEDMIRRQSRTVLLVSHNIRQVERLCKRVIMLEKGRMDADGPPTETCNRYFEKSDARILHQLQQGRVKSAVPNQGSTDIELLGVRLLDTHDMAIDLVPHGEDVFVELKFKALRPLARLTFAVGVHTPDLLYLASKDSGRLFRAIRMLDSEFTVRCRIKSMPFLPGSYSLRICVAQGDGVIFYGENIHHFMVVARTGSRADMSEEGFFPLHLDWELPAGSTAAIYVDSNVEAGP
jgi:lipopolysaccharide transport system ATP-binding protein